MSPDPRQALRVDAGKAAHLTRIDTSATPSAPGDRAGTENATAKLLDELFSLDDRFWAERSKALLVVLQAMDTAGKDGTVKHVFRGLNPEGVRAYYFKQPTEEELAHDFLWRVHARAPRLGEIGIFNRSHYEDVLVVRVHKLAPAKVWQQRYAAIRDFERTLSESGTVMVKLMLHISKDEQRKRLEARLSDPDKRWKFQPGDVKERALWDDYMSAYEDAIKETSTEWAPWYVIPADHKWYRDWAVSRILVETLRELGPRYPKPRDLGKVKIT
jgi:PPK2 family polyphosphate:nucleotide phosphotransferase